MLFYPRSAADFPCESLSVRTSVCLSGAVVVYSTVTDTVVHMCEISFKKRESFKMF